MASSDPPAAPTRRPVAAFAWGRLRQEALFAPEDFARLRQLVRLPDPEPLRSFAEARADGLLAEAEVLVTSWGCPTIDDAVLDRAPHLQLVAHAAGSVRGWGAAVLRRGIRLVNAADVNAIPTAEFALASILLANKRAQLYTARYRRERQGLEVSLSAAPEVGNYRKVVGIVGASRVGRHVMALARPFDWSLLLYDPFVSAEEAAALGAAKLELDELLIRSDVVSLHAPALPATRHLIDARRLALMRDGAILVNTARGALVDQEALVAELTSGRLSAVLDVSEPDVLPAASPLYDLPNVTLTPHLAGSTGNERWRFGRLVVDEITRYVHGEPLRHALDPARAEREA